MERHLASIQIISNIIETPVFDNLELVVIEGWQALVKKNEFKIGEKVIYIEYDSILPDNIPEFKFMESRHYRVKTLKMRGVISQGLVFPVSLLKQFNVTDDGIDILMVDDDVTELLGIIKYEIPDSSQISFARVNNFPVFIPKTDEMRLQSAKRVLDELYDENADDKFYYVSVKEDGSSATYYTKHNYKDEDIHFGVCSRNIESSEKDLKNVYWQIAEKLDLENKLKSFTINQGIEIAIQGEIGGPGMNGSGVFKNPMGYSEVEFKIFSIYDITNRKYLSFEQMKDVLNILKLTNNFVQVIEVSNKVRTLEEWIEFATTIKYPVSNKPAEGIVIRPLDGRWSNKLKDRLSFKVINNKFLLSEKG